MDFEAIRTPFFKGIPSVQFQPQTNKKNMHIYVEGNCPHPNNTDKNEDHIVTEIKCLVFVSYTSNFSCPKGNQNRYKRGFGA